MWGPMWLQTSQAHETSLGWREKAGVVVKADHKALKAKFRILSCWICFYRVTLLGRETFGGEPHGWLLARSKGPGNLGRPEGFRAEASSPLPRRGLVSPLRERESDAHPLDDQNEWAEIRAWSLFMVNCTGLLQRLCDFPPDLPEAGG